MKAGWNCSINAWTSAKPGSLRKLVAPNSSE